MMPLKLPMQNMVPEALARTVAVAQLLMACHTFESALSIKYRTEWEGDGRHRERRWVTLTHVSQIGMNE